MINRLKPNVKTYCQLWFDELNEPIFSKIWEYKFIWEKSYGNYKNGLFQPYMISCRIPFDYRNLVPKSVSVVEKPCDMATTNLRVINNRPEDGIKHDFAVCVKGLDILNQDLSVRLVEWLELLYKLGAHKVFVYELAIHPNVSKVLKYYESLDKVELTKITLPGEQPNIPEFMHIYLKSKITNKRQNEVIPYNDCLYKNMYRYDYITLLDIDEIIMPKTTNSWKELMETIVPKSLEFKNEPRSSYFVRNVYFFDSLSKNDSVFPDIPHYMHMLQHVYRSRNFTEPYSYIKCFHNPERVLTLHNHFPFSCLGKRCSFYAIKPEDAQLQHYRKDCVSDLKKQCDDVYKKHTLMDTTIWQYKESVITRVKNTLNHLGFLPKN